MERRGGTGVGVRNRLGRADHNTKVEKNTTEQEEEEEVGGGGGGEDPGEERRDTSHIPATDVSATFY